MKAALWLWSILSFALLCPTALSQAPGIQERAGEWAWQPFVEHEGVVFAYIYYPARDGAHDSIVVRLENQNEYDVRYRFSIVFRSPEGDEVVEETEGRLGAGEAKTGDLDNLYWIPFSEGERISEVGLRGYEVLQD